MVERDHQTIQLSNRRALLPTILLETLDSWEGRPMNSGWMDELWDREIDLAEGSLQGFYCPYTNASVCALLKKGWQPRELCLDLDCDQLRYIRPRPKRRNRAS